jgi:hypothetical protein
MRAILPDGRTTRSTGSPAGGEAPAAGSPSRPGDANRLQRVGAQTEPRPVEGRPELDHYDRQRGKQRLVTAPLREPQPVERAGVLGPAGPGPSG